MKITINDDKTVTMSLDDFYKHFNVNQTADEQPEQIEILKTQQQPKELELEVTTILSHIGIPRNILGFSYLRDAIILSVQDSKYVNNITSALYPQIASLHSTFVNRAERAIRHAIDRSWGEHAMKTLNMYCSSGFKPGSRKPTNSEFIALIADSLRLKGFDK